MADSLLARAETLVSQWLPGGKRRGGEWVCGGLDGSAGHSCSINLHTGAWGDFSGDEAGGDLISLYAAIRGLKQAAAARELQQDMGWQAPVPEVQPDTKPKKRSSMWLAFDTVPAGAPEPMRIWSYKDEVQDKWVKLQAVRMWAYRFGGALHGYVARFERVSSKTGEVIKDTLPQTWCIDQSDDRQTCAWRWKTWEGVRPLYVPRGEFSGDDRLIVVVEGEKCADALHEMAGELYDAVSWPGGVNGEEKADWGWIPAGRSVVLWSDTDSKQVKLSKAEKAEVVDPESKPYLPCDEQPGRVAMLRIAKRLREQGNPARLVPTAEPGVLADGWDVADAIADGWTLEDVAAHVQCAYVADPDAAALKSLPAQAEHGGEAPAEGADVPEGASTPSPVSDGGGEPAAEKPKKQRKKKPAVKDDAQDEDDGGESWRDRLLYRKGELLDCRENIYLIVRHHEVFAGLIAYNEFAHRIERCGPLPWTAELGEWETADDYKLGLWLAEHMGMPIRSEGTLAAGVAMAAMDCKFHPVRRYLDGLQWDGIDRLDHWLHECLSTRDDTYHKMIGRFFVMGMVARILNPGCQMDTMMILEGAQGRRKSTALRVLAGEWFADTPLKIGDKDATLNLSGVWLYEVAELDAFSKVEVTAVKQYVTSRVDRVREPYARRAVDRPRSCVFGGTTNQDEYLRDPSGGRRFWPVRVRMDIELGKLAEWRDQLYAEAMHRLQQGERYHPTREESEQYIVPEQEEREISDPWFERIAAWLDDKSDKGGYYDLAHLVRHQYTSTQILTQCLGVETHKIDGARQMATRVGVAMHKLGWRKVRDPGGLRLWRYLRPGFTQSGVQILGKGGESVQPSNTPPVEVGRV